VIDKGWNRLRCQQLLKGQEGGSQLEVHFHASKVVNVCDPGGEVVGIEPGPGDTPVVVVVQVPLDSPEQTSYELPALGKFRVKLPNLVVPYPLIFLRPFQI
jgi:hypothetical protein